MYTIYKASNIDCPKDNWEIMEQLQNVEETLTLWAMVVDNLKECYGDYLVQPSEGECSPYDVTVALTRSSLSLSAVVYVPCKVAYKLITE